MQLDFNMMLAPALRSRRILLLSINQIIRIHGATFEFIILNK